MLTATFRAPALATATGISFWLLRKKAVVVEIVVLLLWMFFFGTIKPLEKLAFCIQKKKKKKLDCRCNICSLSWRMLESSMILPCGWKQPCFFLQHFTSNYQTKVKETRCVTDKTSCRSILLNQTSFISSCKFKSHLTV